MAELKEFTITVNSFESGVLMGLVMQAEDRVKTSLNRVWQQLVAMKKEIEEEEGVRKEVIEGGLLRITDKDGNTIIRAPYPFEVEGN